MCGYAYNRSNFRFRSTIPHFLSLAYINLTAQSGCFLWPDHSRRLLHRMQANLVNFSAVRDQLEVPDHVC